MFGLTEITLEGNWHEILKQELREALEDADLEAFDVVPWAVGNEAKTAAYRLAVALGNCRICGVDLPEDLDGDLPPAEAAAAAEILAEVCRNLCEDGRRLGQEWDEAELPEQAELIVADFFASLMETFAAMEAISQAYEQMVATDDPELPRFLVSYDQAVDAILELDRVAQSEEVLTVLCQVIHQPIYRNWQQVLCEPYRSTPWWFGGILEETDAEISREVAAFLAEFRGGKPKAVEPPVARGYVVKATNFLSIAPALAAAAPHGPEIPRVYWWRSPDGQYYARLSVPPQISPTGFIPLEVLDRTGAAAKEFAGKAIILAGLTERVDESGVARYTVETVKKQLEELAAASDGEEVLLTLAVDSADELWQPIEEPEFCD